MRIESRPVGLPPSVAMGPGRATAGTRFAPGGGASSSVSSSRSAASLATLDAILMLQGEEDDGRERRRRSARHGQDLLDALDGLKAALLSGAEASGTLARLSERLAAASGPSGDAGLDEVVAAIELRVQVELAKLGVA